jgi:hypothetical protein
MASNPLSDYLEKTFADAYRKEIDQEENIWRSLPFFAATLALQLTAVAQIRDWVNAATGTILTNHRRDPADCCGRCDDGRAVFPGFVNLGQ